MSHDDNTPAQVVCSRCKQRVDRSQTDVTERGLLCNRCAGFYHAHTAVDRMRVGDAGRVVEAGLAGGVIAIGVAATKQSTAALDANRLDRELDALESSTASPAVASSVVCTRCGQEVERYGSALSDLGEPLCGSCQEKVELAAVERVASDGHLGRGLLLGILLPVFGAVYLTLRATGRRTRVGAWAGTVIVLFSCTAGYLTGWLRYESAEARVHKRLTDNGVTNIKLEALPNGAFTYEGKRSGKSCKGTVLGADGAFGFETELDFPIECARQ